MANVNVSGIDKAAMAARRLAKPGSGKGGTMRAADWVALQNAAKNYKDVLGPGGALIEEFTGAVYEAIKASGLTPDSKNWEPFIEGIQSGTRQKTRELLKTPQIRNNPEMQEALKVIVARVERLSDMAKKDKTLERTEKIVKRQGELFEKAQKEKTLERTEKLIKKEEELAKESKKQQKQAEDIQGKAKVFFNYDEKNLKERGRLADLERKQRELYNKDLAKGDMSSKIMHREATGMLERISKVVDEANNQKDTLDKEMLEALFAINDTLHAMQQAPIGERRQYQESLAGQIGVMKAIAADPTKGANGRVFSHITKQAELSLRPAMRPRGIAGQLADWGKDTIKDAARNVWEQSVPVPFRIIGEGLYRGIAGNMGDKKRLERAEAAGMYARNKKVIEEQRETVLRGAPESFVQRTEVGPIKLERRKTSHRSRISVAGGNRIRPADTSSSDSPLGDMHVERLIVGTMEVGGRGGDGKESLADRVGKEANEVKTGKGFNLGALKNLFGGFFGKLLGMIGMIGTLFMGTIGRLVGAVGPLLAMGGRLIAGLGPLIGLIAKFAGPALAVGVAGAAGYAVGTAITKGADWVAQKITGREGESAQSLIMAGVDKVQERAGGALGKSEQMKQDEHQLKVDTELFAKSLAQQGGEMTSKQIERWKKRGVDVSAAKVNEDVVQRGLDGKPLSAQMVPDVIPKNQWMPDESPAEAARMKSGGVNSALAAPSAAIHERTNMIDAASRQVESSKEVRSSKPTVVVNNVGGDKGSSSMSPPGISLGAARNQENAFARYLAASFAAL